MLSLWVQVAAVHQKLLEEHAKTKDQKAISIPDILEPEVEKLYQVKEQLVCLKYDIQVERLRDNLKIHYKNDPEVMGLQADMQAAFQDAIHGKQPLI